MRDGVIPAALVTSSSHFHREAAGIVGANGVRIQVCGIDLIRDEAGTWRVLEDNVRVPSGVSYVISNRRVMAQTLPELFVSMKVRPVGDYPNKLLRRRCRPRRPKASRTPPSSCSRPGVFNSAYYEHTLLARLMGVELVEGRDLFCSGGRVWMRTTAGPTRVDVIYRRVDDEFLDPLQFRADSMLGSPGLLLAARLGNVTIANAVGNGVADDKLVYTYLPDLIRYYLAEDPLIPNVDTWRLEDPGALEEVLDRLDELVVKPVDGSGGKGLVVGPAASQEGARRTARAAHRRPARMDRAARRAAVDHPDPRRCGHAPASRRPAPVRRQRRQGCLGAAGRPDPGRAARGRARRQQLAGRRIERHLGRRAGPAADHAAQHPGPRRRPGRRHQLDLDHPHRATTCRTTRRWIRPRNDQEQQQQQARTAPAVSRLASRTGTDRRASSGGETPC